MPASKVIGIEVVTSDENPISIETDGVTITQGVVDAGEGDALLAVTRRLLRASETTRAGDG